MSLHGRPLLNKATESRNCRNTALLVERRVKRWKENNRELIEEYWRREGDEKETRCNKTVKRWESNLKMGGETGAASIRKMVRDMPGWLVEGLERPALVEATPTKVGGNIYWIINDGVSSARDMCTGRELDMEQTLFKEPVELLLAVEYENYVRERITVVSGTVEEVLQSIYTTYKPVFGVMGTELVFGELELDAKQGYYELRIQN